MFWLAYDTLNVDAIRDDDAVQSGTTSEQLIFFLELYSKNLDNLRVRHRGNTEAGDSSPKSINMR